MFPQTVLPPHLAKLDEELFDIERMDRKIDIALQESPSLLSCKRDRFFDIVPVGFNYVMLNCISPKWAEDLLMIKVKLKILFQIYYELADLSHSSQHSQTTCLLEELYKLPLQSKHLNFEKLSKEQAETLHFCTNLWHDVINFIPQLPYYHLFKKFFFFDIQQFYIANRYWQLIRKYPEMSNKVENRSFLSHHMGIVINGMIDFMGTTEGRFDELGAMRNVLYKAQIICRISRVMNTLERSIRSGDISNEVIAIAIEHMLLPTQIHKKTNDELQQIFAPVIQKIHLDVEKLYREITTSSITTFCVHEFARGLKALHHLFDGFYDNGEIHYIHWDDIDKIDVV
ncbi:hypothetical protein [Candidatus Uabimicrobium amorphum]|uniref:Terpene synthase n=1 Tax=Uabimicrobium amorphum TaxID=2596890 RepID=A0A5S9IQ85_UABAM|nr:hypothetical protein [Candidatus Uabimicrobium amorphum]BBM86093.1 hypothetical protein UABAM_04479 [Candidatus Uabimicrobium amorphum]